LARAARQDLVLQAIKDKVLSTKVLLSPAKITALIKSVNQFVESDVDINSASVLARKILQSRERYRSYVLLEEFLDNPPISSKYDNLYVFVPKEGNWNNVHTWVSRLLNN
jgi:anionic cell wall polymer biosynthesis LytR-Cps2A-Psr (LCP) family protein